MGVNRGLQVHLGVKVMRVHKGLLSRPTLMPKISTIIYVSPRKNNITKLGMVSDRTALEDGQAQKKADQQELQIMKMEMARQNYDL